MGLFTLLARCFFAPRKKPSLAQRLAAAPLAPRRLERRRVLDAAAVGAVLAPLGDSSEFVQVSETPAAPPPPAATVVANGEAENTPPDNLQIVPLDDLFENGIAELSFSFEDPDFEDTHTVEIDWGDGTLPETINLDPGERFVLTSHQYLDDNPTGTPMDVNQVQVTVTDSNDGQVSGSAPIQVSNIAPTIDSLVVTSPINENGIAELQMTFTDPGSLDTHTVDIDWGDGTPLETINLTGGERFVQTTHQYLDDNPTGTPSDMYQVQVTVTDDDTGSGMKTADVTVNNVAPTIDSLIVTSPIDENGIAELQMTFTDPGSLDTHTVDIDWGDGTPLETINLTGGERFVQTTHQYLDDNPTGTPSDMNQVQVTVTDDDTGSGMKTADVTVNNVNPQVTVLNVTPSIIDENNFVELQFSFTDVGTLDTHQVEIDWDDGSPTEMIDLTGVDTTGVISRSHEYLDNDDDNIYTIIVSVIDDDTGIGTGTIDVEVLNVNPTFVDVDPMTPNVIIATDVNTKGETTLTVQFTDPGKESEFRLNDQSPFEILVDWGENPSMPGSQFVVERSLDEVPTGAITIVHTYLGPPDPLHPANDIIISVKFRDDDFYTPMPFVMDRGESVIETIAISNPGIGAEPFRIDTTPQVPRLEFRREASSNLLLEASNTTEDSLRGADLRAVSTDSKATTETVLELRVIDAYGVEGEGIPLRAEVLNNLPNLFLRLPDNHYAIYLIRIETATERLVIEVYVRNGKLIDPNDDSEGTRDRPPSDEAAQQNLENRPRLEETEAQPEGPVESPVDIEAVRRALEAELESGGEILIQPVAEPDAAPDDRGAMLSPSGLLPIAAGLVATRSFGSWARQVDRAVAQAGPKKWRELRQRSRKKWKNR